MLVEINHNKEKGGIELRFTGKLSDELKERLRLTGFNYSKRYDLYWTAYAEGLMKYLEELKEALEKGKDISEIKLYPSFEPSEENLDLRNFSYVSLSYKEEGEPYSKTEYYVVFEPNKNLAALIVWEAAKEFLGKNLKQVKIYPRKYLKKARALSQGGQIIGVRHASELSTGKEEGDSVVDKNENGSAEKKSEEILENISEKDFTGEIEDHSETSEQGLSAGESKEVFSFLQPYSGNYKKLQRLIPDLEKHLELETAFGKSRSKAFMDLSYDFLEKDEKDLYHISLAHYFEKNGDLIADPDMELRINTKMKMVEALHYQDQFGYKPVYIKKGEKIFVNTKEKKEQNKFLSKWLPNLLNQGHQIFLKQEEDEKRCKDTLLEFSPKAMAEVILKNDELHKLWKGREDSLENEEFSSGELLELERFFHHYVCQDSQLQIQYVTIFGAGESPVTDINSSEESEIESSENANPKKEYEINHQMEEKINEEKTVEKENIGSLLEKENFLENISENIWDLIPEKDKKQTAIKEVEWKADPKDQGLQKLVAHFMSADDLRPVLMAVYFDKEGIVATDAQKLLFLKTDQKKFRGLYCMSSECWKNIRYDKKDGEGLTKAEEQKIEDYRKGKMGFYPDYKSVVNIEPKKIFSLDVMGLYSYVKALKKVGIIRPKYYKILLKAGEMTLGVNGEYITEGIKALLSAGHKELQLGVIAPDKAIFLAPAGNMEKVKSLETDFVLVMPQPLEAERLEDGFLRKGELYYDLENQKAFTSGIGELSPKNKSSVKSNEERKSTKEDKRSKENKRLEKGKAFVASVKKWDAYTPNVLVPFGIEEPFASSDFNVYDMEEVMKNDFPSLLEITEDKLPELDAITMFELSQFSHPSDYGVDVSRSSLLQEWEKRGEELFKELGYPIDADYPYVNVNTGYKSIDPLGKLIQPSIGGDKKWWSVVEHNRPLADLEKAIRLLEEKIETGKNAKKDLSNKSTGKIKANFKAEVSQINWDIERYEEGVAYIKNYLSKNGNPFAEKKENEAQENRGQQENLKGNQNDNQNKKQNQKENQKKKSASTKEEDVLLQGKNQHELNVFIEDFILTRDNEEDGVYSEEEKQYISQYTGGGGLIKQGAEGKGVLYEYYTPDAIVKKMWELAYKYGYSGGSVLEPACGTGRFLKYAHAAAEPAVAYEINPTAVRIVEILYPKVEIHQKVFESNFFAGNIHLKGNYSGKKFDLIIGNPPYGDFSGKWAGMGEKKYTGALEYDQYFMVRGLEMLNPGGLLIFIIPSAFLQNASKYNAVKEKIQQTAELIDAYRLPIRVFDTTDIGTDIVVFKSVAV